MKKNNMLRLASVLLVAVLLSTCAISGVFAHYYTDAAADDSARVAKWGVVVTASTGAFSATYDVADDPNFTVVSANGTDKVVAPGTEGSLADMTVTGAPEVDVQVTKTADITLTGWNIPNGTDGEGNPITKEYCPIVITVNTVEYYMGATVPTEILADGKIDSVADFESAVEKAILGSNTGVYNYDANTDLSAESLDVDVNWAWAFGAQSADDTALGNLATAPTISIDVSIAVEQVGD